MSKKFKQFDNKNLDVLRDDLETTLTNYGNKVGLKFDFKGFRYSDTNVTITIESTIEGAKSNSEKDLERHTHYKTGDPYTNRYGVIQEGTIVVGYESKNTRYPLIVKKSNGKRYKVEYVDLIDGAEVRTVSINDL